MRVTLSYLVIFLLGKKCEYIFFTYNSIYIYIYICLIRIMKMMKITEINRLCVYIMQER